MNIYKELALLFTKLGLIAFGGPMAHISLIEKEVVEKRKWFSTEEFLEMISFTNFLPGPNSTEIAILVGYKKAKIKGMLISGFCFVVPAVLIVLSLTLAYLNFKSIPNVTSVFSGLRPVIAAIVTSTAFNLSKKRFKTAKAFDILAFFLLTLLLLTGMINEIQALLLGGFIYLFVSTISKKSKLNSIEPFSLSLLFITMLKIGSILYGSGYVLMAYLKTELVDTLKWIDLGTLSDLLALGEISPGPVFTTATAVGTYLGNIPGGIIATLGIFTPSFLLIGILYPLFNKMKTWSWFQTILKGFNLVSLAIIIVTAFNLSTPLLNSPVQVFNYFISLVLIYKTKVSHLFIIILSGLSGLAFL